MHTHIRYMLMPHRFILYVLTGVRELFMTIQVKSKLTLRLTTEKSVNIHNNQNMFVSHPDRRRM